MTLTDFYKNTTKNFTETISYNGSPPNITSDTVTIYFKTDKSISDANATITETADVTTSGASGIAIFNLTEEETDVSAGNYYYEIVWALTTGERYILESSTINILQTVSD